MTITRDEVYKRLSHILIEAFKVDEEEVQLPATLLGDLGLESIDFLDLIFRLERQFGIKIPRGELFPESIFQGDPEMVKGGRVTDKGMAELRMRMPFADLRAFDKIREIAQISDLFTVELVYKYVCSKLGIQ